MEIHDNIERHPTNTFANTIVDNRMKIIKSDVRSFMRNYSDDIIITGQVVIEDNKVFVKHLTTITKSNSSALKRYFKEDIFIVDLLTGIDL